MATNLLTDRKIQSLTPKDSIYKVGDGNGLMLEVTPTGTKRWIWRGYLNKKPIGIRLGVYPDTTLAFARKTVAEYRRDIAEGRDPRTGRAVKSLTFKELAVDWFKRYEPKVGKDVSKATWSRIERYLLPNLGDAPCVQITPRDVLNTLDVLSPMLQRKTLSNCARIFDHAVTLDVIPSNPCLRLSKELKALPQVQNRAAILDENQFGFFWKNVKKVGNLGAENVIRLIAYTAVRADEACGAMWNEFDLESCTWLIPAERMKMGQAHRVALSRQAVEVLMRQRQYTEEQGVHSPYVFPSFDKKGITLPSRTVLRHLQGVSSEMSLHGFRAVFSTICYSHDKNPMFIEAALAHMDKNKVRAAYCRTDYLEQRREMMQWYADYIDALTSATRTD